MLNSEQILEVVVKAADDKLAEDITVLDVRGLTTLGDYFVIMNGRNERQMGAIIGGVVDEAHKNNIEIKNQEGKDSGNWVLLDLADVVVHVFSSGERSYYNLEKLWSDAPIVDISAMISK
ncbi:ribosome silencing factor [Jeotgalibaca arthritidis]|jgi:ribosome-associated protein|uniref:Ribosomal silencing factor RsfS n=1 Tax=Jeotgalibaca arthritidis TaxID=1868794 RepID=A0A6G7KBE4_9LACT|nr:ribosome silencing factor [Jeotgalibaca arthritidis]QII82570.1 ribosome silencing factor [Jeotgalibaca arthritidis]